MRFPAPLFPIYSVFQRLCLKKLKGERPRHGGRYGHERYSVILHNSTCKTWLASVLQFSCRRGERTRTTCDKRNMRTPSLRMSKLDRPAVAGGILKFDNWHCSFHGCALLHNSRETISVKNSGQKMEQRQIGSLFHKKRETWTWNFAYITFRIMIMAEKLSTKWIRYETNGRCLVTISNSYYMFILVFSSWNEFGSIRGIYFFIDNRVLMSVFIEASISMSIQICWYRGQKGALEWS